MTCCTALRSLLDASAATQRWARAAMAGSSSWRAPSPTTTNNAALQNLKTAITRSTRSGASAAGAATADVIPSSGRLQAHSGERTIVERAEQRLGGDGAEQRHEHVPLRIPHVALRAEERLRGRAAGHGDPPLDELIACADREANRGDEHEQPAARAQRRRPQQDLPGHDGGHEALHEVAQSIIVVAGKPEGMLCPGAQRDALVRVVTAQHENEGVDGQQRRTQEGGNDLQAPGRPVLRREARDDQRAEYRDQQNDRVAWPPYRGHSHPRVAPVSSATLGWLWPR